MTLFLPRPKTTTKDFSTLGVFSSLSIIQLVVKVTGRRILVVSQLVGSSVGSREFHFMGFFFSPVWVEWSNRLPNSPQIFVFFLCGVFLLNNPEAERAEGKS
jgi:hypothetical protein